jgi:hypothetical protein
MADDPGKVTSAPHCPRLLKYPGNACWSKFENKIKQKLQELSKSMNFNVAVREKQ